jgi:hypothetical protein
MRSTKPGTRALNLVLGRDVLGQNFNAMLRAHMVSVNGIGIELFQLLDPPHKKRAPRFQRPASETFPGRSEAFLVLGNA